MTPSTEFLTARGLHKSFSGDHGTRAVLGGVDFHVARGEFVAIVGPSGCGKSTLFTLLAGLDDADSGEIVLGSERITAGVPRCAYMPQNDLLFPWRSVLENASLGLEVQGVPRARARERAGTLFAEFGLDGFEDARPSQLSGGMRQRAALVRTVVQERPLLLLDEPLGALDSLTRTDMQYWLQDVWSRFRWTALMITHDVREALLLADRVLVLAPRPTRVAREIRVDLPRPRTLDTTATDEFTALEREVLAALVPTVST